MKQIKNIKLGINNFYVIFFFISLLNFNISYSNESNLKGKYIEIKILDKVSSKNTTIKLKIGEEKKFQNLLIKPLKCNNSQFDDNPDTAAYIQVKDITQKNNDKVFVFNGWTFSSSPSLRPFDHPVYDIWLKKCFN